MPSKAPWVGSTTFSTSFEQSFETQVYLASSLGQAVFIHFPIWSLCLASSVCPTRSAFHPSPTVACPQGLSCGERICQFFPAMFSPWVWPVGSSSRRWQAEEKGLEMFVPQFPLQNPTGWLCPATNGSITCRAALHTASLSPGFVLQARGGNRQSYCS